MQPASPKAPTFLVGKKLKQPISPKVPHIRPLYRAVWDWAQSSTTNRPWRRATSRMGSMSQTWP